MPRLFELITPHGDLKLVVLHLVGDSSRAIATAHYPSWGFETRLLRCRLTAPSVTALITPHGDLKPMAV